MLTSIARFEVRYQLKSPIFWITMNRPGPLSNAQTNEPVNHDAYNSK